METKLVEWVDSVKNSNAKQVLHERRNEIKLCPLCNHSIEDRKIAIYEELITQLYAIYRWCGEHKQHEFSMKDIRHLLDFNGYTRFNDLIQCSNGILYRPTGEDDKPIKRGRYGLHMTRAKAFFKGERPVHLQISMDQITGEWIVLRETFIGSIPPLKALVDKNGIYDYETLL